MQILCALVSSDDTKQRWLQSAGVVKLLQRLTLDSHMDIDVGLLFSHRFLVSLLTESSLAMEITGSPCQAPARKSHQASKIKFKQASEHSVQMLVPFCVKGGA